jgi:hypothetical protein
MLAHGVAASPEERGGGGWGQAAREMIAPLAPFCGLALGLFPPREVEMAAHGFDL